MEELNKAGGKIDAWKLEEEGRGGKKRDEREKRKKKDWKAPSIE